MRIIGLTGGIASGKSTVSKELQALGAVIIDADKIAWRLAEPGGAIWQEYYDRYGDVGINDDNSLNRRAVAERVFADKSELKWMNEMAHPLIRAELVNKVKALSAQEDDLAEEMIVVLDVPLLFESKWQILANETWLVYTTYDLQVARLKSRNNMNREEAEQRIDSQMSMEEKRSMADFIIENTGTREELLKDVHHLWNRLIKK